MLRWYHWIAMGIGVAFAYYMAYAIFNGTGMP